MNEQYGIELTVLLNKFKEKIKQVKSDFSSIKDETIYLDIDGQDVLDVYGSQLESVKREIYDLSGVLEANSEKPFMNEKEIEETKIKLEKLLEQYDRLTAAEDEVEEKGKKSFNSMSSGIEKVMNKIKRYALSLFSIRSVYSLISRASSAYLSQDTELANKLQAVWVGLGSILAPIIEGIANILLKGVKYINIFIKALTGVDLLAKATAKSMAKAAKSAKGLNKSLAGFDELNNLDTTSNTETDPNWTDAYNNIQINENVAKIIENIGKGIRNAWEWFLDNWQNVVIGIVGIVGALLLFKALKAIFSPVKSVSDVFSGFLNSIGKAAEAIAIMGGIALVISQVIGLISAFKESGMSLDEVAGLLGNTLAELAIAFTVIAAASKLMDWQGVAGAAVILAGFALVISQVTVLLNAFSKSGLTMEEVGGLMAVVLGTLVGLMASVALIGPAMTAGLVPFLAVIVGINATLLVMAATLPIILEAAAKFINDIAPSIQLILETMGVLITNIIVALGTTLPPIIKSVGEIFKTIFDGISKTINAVGNVIINILNTTGNLVVTVLSSILYFINNLGPAINNFVDGTIRAVTKLINFLISAIEYLVNTLVVGSINKIASAVNNALSFTGLRIPTVSMLNIPRFVPRLDTGTNYVPEDQLAYIHKGEAVVPKKFNSDEYFRGNNQETNNLLQQVIEAINNIDMNPHTTIDDVGKAAVNYINSKKRQIGRSVV